MRCHVLTPAGKEDSSWDPGFPVHRIPYAPSPFRVIAQCAGGIPAAISRNPFNLLLVPFLVAGIFASVANRAGKFDVVHAHWSVTGAICCSSRLFHRRPVVTTLRGSDWSGGGKGLKGWLTRYACRQSQGVTAVSRAIGVEASRKLGGKRVEMVPNGVDHVFFTIPPPKGVDPPLKVLFLGSLTSNKSVDTLVAALALLHPGQAVLTIAGEGDERVRLEDMVWSMGLEEMVRFTGAVSPQEVPGLMASHDLLVLPSLSEGRPNVVLEAMAAGRGVVATDIEGVRELVRDGENGWLFKPRDVKGLAFLLDQASKGTLDIVSAGRMARKSVEGLEWGETARRYTMVYLKAMGGCP